MAKTQQQSKQQQQQAATKGSEKIITGEAVPALLLRKGNEHRNLKKLQPYRRWPKP